MKKLMLLAVMPLCGCAALGGLFVNLPQLAIDSAACNRAINVDETAGDGILTVLADPTVDAACTAVAKDLGVTVANFIIDIEAASKSTGRAATEARALKAERK